MFYQNYPYDESGRILGSASTESEDAMAGYQGDYVTVLSDSVQALYSCDTHYVLNGEIVERPASPVTRTDLTLHDVPNGATLFINGESYAAEGEVELEFPLSGTYRLRVECFPYLDWNDEVTV